MNVVPTIPSIKHPMYPDHPVNHEKNIIFLRGKKTTKKHQCCLLLLLLCNKNEMNDDLDDNSTTTTTNQVRRKKKKIERKSFQQQPPQKQTLLVLFCFVIFYEWIIFGWFVFFCNELNWFQPKPTEIKEKENPLNIFCGWTINHTILLATSLRNYCCCCCWRWVGQFSLAILNKMDV